MSLPSLLFVVFLTLKLTNYIDWSWWWITSPLWIVACIWFVCTTLYTIAKGIE